MSMPLPMVSDKASAMLKEVLDKHPCGKCTACCYVLGVAELGKPYYKDCKHLWSTGCEIYEARPEMCKGFECLWRVGLVKGGSKLWRPDNVGVIFDIEDNSDGTQSLMVYECMVGAFNCLRKKDIMDVYRSALAIAQITIIRVHFYGSKIGVQYPIDIDYGTDLEYHTGVRKYDPVDGLFQVFQEGK